MRRFFGLAPCTVYLLQNARILSPEPCPDRTLLTGGGRVLWMGDEYANAIAQAPEVEVIDLGGRCVIPGLVDCHAHVTGGGGESGFASQVPAPMLSRYTQAGVTSVIGLLGTDDVTRTTSSVLARTRALREEGLSAWCYTGGYHLPPTTLTGSVSSDIVHLDPVVGVGELALSDHRSSQPTLNELLRIASDAHVAGMMTGKAGVVHLHLGDGERGLQLVREALDRSELPPRVFHPTHVNRRKALFEEALELANRGCTIDVTAFPVMEGEDAWSAADAIRIYLDRGLPPERLTVSSDGGGCLPVFDGEGRMTSMDIGDASALLETFRELLADGHEPSKVLPFFTRNPATLMRLPRKGTIKKQGDADLIVLDEDLSVWGVMARGEWHIRNKKQVVRGFFEGECSVSGAS